MSKEPELFQMFIFTLKLKKIDYETMHRKFIKDRAGPTIHFSRGMIEGFREAIEIAEKAI